VVLGVLVWLSAATFAAARAQSPTVTSAAMAVTCLTPSLEAPWTGSDTVSCTVSTTQASTTEAEFACEAPPGIVCTVEPSRAQLRTGEDARVAARVTYAETLAPGRSTIKIVARHSSTVADTELVVTKDINSVSARCPTAAEIQTIDREFRLVFTSDPTKGTAGCTKDAGSRDLTIMQSRVYRALAVMKRLTFTEPLPWTRESAYRWLIGAVRGVHFRADIQNSSCCSGDGLIDVRAVVEPGQFGGQQGFVLAITESKQMPTDFRMLVSFMQLLVHEARHADGKRHTCGTRDRTLTELGAWGTAHAFQAWIADRMAPGFVPDEVKAHLRQQTEQICRFQICQGCQ
jgi:hypothetical protein